MNMCRLVQGIHEEHRAIFSSIDGVGFGERGTQIVRGEIRGDYRWEAEVSES